MKLRGWGLVVSEGEFGAPNRITNSVTYFCMAVCLGWLAGSCGLQLVHFFVAQAGLMSDFHLSCANHTLIDLSMTFIHYFEQ